MEKVRQSICTAEELRTEFLRRKEEGSPISQEDLIEAAKARGLTDEETGELWEILNEAGAVAEEECIGILDDEKILSGVSPDSTDIMKRYLEAIGRFRLLTAEEEKLLAKRIAEGDKDALEAMVQSNLRLVVFTAKKFAYSEVPLPDLIQQGNLGLLEAAQKFDGERGCRFSTYATFWIRQKISRGIVEMGGPVRIPYNKAELYSKFKGAERVLSQELGREPTLKEIAEKMDGIPEEKLRELKEMVQNALPLDAPTKEEDDTRVGELIADPLITAPDRAAELNILHEELENVLRRMTEREEKLIRLRYGLNDGHPRTLQETADILHVTRERARQIETRALRRMKHLSQSRELLDFFK